MRSDRDRLLDILEAVEKIEKYVEKGRERFFGDELIQIWTMYHIQVIGEAATNLSPALCRQYPEIPWADVVAMRNVLIHQYFGIDLQQVWDTVTIDLPKLKRDINAILSP
jgi:uncharacterized protein with HEPN domain